MRNKIILLISLLIILTVVVIIYVINSSKNNTVDQPLNINTTDTSRPVFNTNTNNDTDININTDIPIETVPSVGESQEFKIVNNINKLFSNWQITKDEKILKELIDITGGADNEALYDPWINFFVEGNHKEFVKIINTSENRKDTTQKTLYIFEWFIYGSGEYENLSSARRQEILNQYNQLKKDLGIK